MAGRNRTMRPSGETIRPDIHERFMKIYAPMMRRCRPPGPRMTRPRAIAFALQCELPLRVVAAITKESVWSLRQRYSVPANRGRVANRTPEDIERMAQRLRDDLDEASKEQFRDLFRKG